ncbi:hypothetical protein [Micromonospora humi]|uniref:Uncharacterized protein n=1 Tax=Micromonospora humi TaxID=745366 RepID=A0A1C5HIK6_9ACTN|nr:hypothetical protein [Micromonospora humi]SCG45814.1 hypothetical protein GA0070213_103166 [Micromonospora humi]
MGGFPIIVTVLYLVVSAVAVTVSWWRARSARHALDGVHQEAVRRTTRWRWTGVIVGMALGAGTAASDPLELGALLAAPVFGLSVLVSVLVSESRVAPPRGATRSAAVEVRTVGDYLPRRLSGAVAVAAAGLAALLAVTTASGGPDDFGNPGRALKLHCPPTTSEGHGPWPGSFYSIPLAVLVLLGLVTAYVVLRSIVRRPRLGSTADLIRVDDLLRRRAARAVAGAGGILVGLPLAGVCATAAWTLLATACGPAWGKPVGWFLLAVLPAVIAFTAWCTTAVLVPEKPAAHEAAA